MWAAQGALPEEDTDMKLSPNALSLLGDLEQGSMALSEISAAMAPDALQLVAYGLAQFDGPPGMEPRLEITGEGMGAMVRSWAPASA